MAAESADAIPTTTKRKISDTHPLFHYKLLSQIMDVRPKVKWDMDTGKDAKLKPISKALEALQRPFVIGGEIKALRGFDSKSSWRETPVANIELKLASGESLGRIGSLDLKAIEAVATVAPFGKGTETVVDTSVRLALEIPAKLLDEDVPNAIADQLRRDVDTLAPPGKKFDIRFYKMHIYKEGGFFSSHADTLHGKNHMATLVVGFPMEYKGGELVVQNNDQSHTFALTSAKKMKWGAFYTDCLHEVKPVTQGVRAVFQFDLFLDGGDDAVEKSGDGDDAVEKSGGGDDAVEKSGDGGDDAVEKSGDGDEDAEKSGDDDYDTSTNNLWFGNNEHGYHPHAPIEVAKTTMDCQHFIKVLETYWKSCPNTRLGILLNHRYATSALDPSFLKGFDRLLYDTAQKAGWGTQLKSVLLTGSSYHDSTEYDSFAAHPFDVSDIEELCKRAKITLDSDDEDQQNLSGEDEQDNSGDDDQQQDGSDDENKATDVADSDATPKVRTVILIPGPDAEMIRIRHTSYVEHTGNESAPEENTYFSATLLLERSGSGK
jgi:hypothetical protein